MRVRDTLAVREERHKLPDMGSLKPGADRAFHASPNPQPRQHHMAVSTDVFLPTPGALHPHRVDSFESWLGVDATPPGRMLLLCRIRSGALHDAVCLVVWILGLGGGSPQQSLKLWRWMSGS